MKRLHTTRYIHFLLALLLTAGLAACAEDDFRVDPDDPTDGRDMPVRIGFDLPYEETPAPATRASVVGGTEDPLEYVKTLYMVCFTRDGIYLGFRKAILVGNEKSFSHDGRTCWGRELFEGTVPARTARVHFVANVKEETDADGNVTPLNIPGIDQIGGNENTLVKSARMTSNLNNERICYWGFHGETSSEAMREWLAVYNESTLSYEKNEDHMVHLVRDRARIEFGHMFDYPRTEATTYTDNGVTYTLEENKTDYVIDSIHWILSNGLERGYLAPYNEGNSADHFAGYYNAAATPPLAEDRLTAYDKADARRYEATKEQMVLAYARPTGDGTAVVKSAEPSVPLYLFEDENDANNPPKLILRVKYKVNGKTEKTKYHTLMLMRADNQPCKILRNHSYVLDVRGLPWEGLGYSNFADAVNSVEYANNRTVTINDKVAEVNDGRFTLKIEGSTYLLYDKPDDATKEHSVVFTYAAAVTDASASTDGIDVENDFEVTAKNISGAAIDKESVKIAKESNTKKVFTGKISFKLGSNIGNILQTGQITLRNKATGLTRFINVYTITQFNFLPDEQTSLKLEPVEGQSRWINEVECPTYSLTFKVPGNYPVGLYPIKVRMASTTLNPYKCTYTDADGTTREEESIGVVMEGTADGTELDGETLAGMAFSSTVGDWNYAADPWNYWYVYTKTGKPFKTNADGSSEEDTDNKTYTIYFDDIRALRPSAAATSVGLFFKIKHFGPAVSVTHSDP